MINYHVRTVAVASTATHTVQTIIHQLFAHTSSPFWPTERHKIPIRADADGGASVSRRLGAVRASRVVVNISARCVANPVRPHGIIIARRSVSFCVALTQRTWLKALNDALIRLYKHLPHLPHAFKQSYVRSHVRHIVGDIQTRMQTQLVHIVYKD